MSSNNEKKQSNTPTKVSNELVSEDVVRQMVQNEATKIELQKQKLALQSKNLDKQHDFACKSLEAQREYNRITPKEKRKDFITAGIFIIILVVLILIFFGFCIFKNQVDLVITILKYTLLIILSFTGGTFYGKSKSTKKKKRVDDSIIEDAEELK